MGATANSQFIDFDTFLFMFSHLHLVLKKPIYLRFPPILARFRLFWLSHLGNLIEPWAAWLRRLGLEQ
jgi:hypothetical protein